jgi:hypothetical protein
MSTPAVVNPAESHPPHRAPEVIGNAATSASTAKPPACSSTFHELVDVKRKHALRNHTDAQSEAGSNTKYIVENLLPERQLGVIVGNSGLGKSPALYQLAICVAAGVAFLGDRTTETDVLYLDFENGAGASNLLAKRIAKFLGLPEVPENFLRWNADDCAASFGRPGHGVEDIIRDWSRATAATGRPKLAIVDPLRFWLQTVEDARHADEQIQLARRVIRETGAGILGVHHLRRVSGEAAIKIPLLETDPRTWIQAMSRGAGALINGSDTRLGLETAACKFAHDKEALVLAGFRRVHGQLGPIYLERVTSEEDGEPLGYRRLASVELLANPDHTAAFQRFPARFTFSEASQLFGKSDSATTNLLKKCAALKLLKKEGRHYVKAAA